MEDAVEEVVELSNLAVLGEDEVGLAIKFVPTYDDIDTAPENFLTFLNQVEAVCNAD